MLKAACCVVAATIALSAGTVGSASAKQADRCEKLASWFGKATKKIAFLTAAKKLERLSETDSACVAAPRAAYDKVMELRATLIEVPTGQATRAAVRRDLERFWQLTRMMEAIISFRRVRIRAQAALELGRLFEEEATVLAHLGNNPETLFIMKDAPEALYHTRAVDIRQYMKLLAQDWYERVTIILRKAKPTNATLVAAQERIEAFKDEERATAQPQPKKPETPGDAAAVPVPE